MLSIEWSPHTTNCVCDFIVCLVCVVRSIVILLLLCDDEYFVFVCVCVCVCVFVIIY